MRTAIGRGRDADKSKFPRALLYFSCSFLTLPRLLSQDLEERPQKHDCGTEGGPLGGGGAVSDSQERIKGARSHGGGGRKKQVGGLALAGGDGQAGGRVL